MKLNVMIGLTSGKYLLTFDGELVIRCQYGFRMTFPLPSPLLGVIFQSTFSFVNHVDYVLKIIEDM